MNTAPDGESGSPLSKETRDRIDWIHGITWSGIPEAVRAQARRCVLDTVACAVAGHATGLSRIAYAHAAAFYGGTACRLWLDGRAVSLAGAVFAHGTSIDALDIHDNCNLVKGHVGVAVVPAALATAEAVSDRVISGEELLTMIVVGYEVAVRAGLALHATACDYHSSGAWNALGCAAVTARGLRLGAAATRHALGAAEYHGPRSPMMRCIDHPTMLKDGSGWGAMVGTSSAWLAREGFTGAPSLTFESQEVVSFWQDLGHRWHTCWQDFKRHAVCHWAQPAIAGTLKALDRCGAGAEQIARIRVYTFHEATRLTTRRPLTTEQAQYSLPFSVAAAVYWRGLGVSELSGQALRDPRVIALADRVELIEEQQYNESFPSIQAARVEVQLTDGQVLDSGRVLAPWDEAGVPATDEELLDKFRWLAGGQLADVRVQELERMLWELDTLPDIAPLLDLLAMPPPT